MLLWWPLGERPGLGTLLNVVLIGAVYERGHRRHPHRRHRPTQLLLMIGGVSSSASAARPTCRRTSDRGRATASMTGLHHRFGWSIRSARTAIELIVLVIGWALGGTIGLGTVVFALGIGPVIQVVPVASWTAMTGSAGVGAPGSRPRASSASDGPAASPRPG